MDIKLSDNGDLVCSSGDLSLTQDSAEEKGQMVMCRVKTSAPDWFHHPWLGANLEELYGEPNTRETAEKGVEGIRFTLSKDDYLLPTEYDISYLPYLNGITYFIKVIDKESHRPVIFTMPVPLGDTQ